MRTIDVRSEDPGSGTFEQLGGALLDRQGVIAYPTETGYAFGCAPGAPQALQRIRRLRGLGPNHTWTLLAPALDWVTPYARVGPGYREPIEGAAPGLYTFVLPATEEIPRQLRQKDRATIGVRLSDSAVARGLVEALGTPLITTSARVSGEEWALEDAVSIAEDCADGVDVLLDAGVVPPNPSTVVDLTGEEPAILRYGAGDPAPFGG